MNQYLQAMWDGAVEGAKEAPRGFFAPLVVLTRWMCKISDEGMAPSGSTFTISQAARKSLEATAKQRCLDPAVALELAIQQFSEKGITDSLKVANSERG